MTIPYTFQLQDTRAIHRFLGRAYLSEDMGLGKSFISLFYVMRHPEVFPVVIVCPANLKLHWQGQARSHANLASDVLRTRKGAKLKATRSSPVTIVNFDILGSWMSYLKSIQPKLIIVDESHNLGNRTSQRSKNVKQLCKGVPHILFLSGTPITSRPIELWVPLSILRPDIFKSFGEFARRYCAPKRNMWGGWDYRGAIHLDELHEILTKTCMIRRRKIDVLDQLPPKQRTIVPLELSPADMREYNTAEQDFINWLARNFDRGKADRAAKAERLTRVGYLKRLAAKLKLTQVFDWIDNFIRGTDEKIVIFAWHQQIIDLIHKKYKEVSVTLTGGTSEKEKEFSVTKFLNNKQVRIFVGNIKAAGVGWSAKGVSTVAFVELEWSPGLHAQAEDRVHGIGRGTEGQHSEIYYLIAKDTVEEKLCEILQKKQVILSKTLDGGKNEDDLEIFDELLKAVKAVKGVRSEEQLLLFH